MRVAALLIDENYYTISASQTIFEAAEIMKEKQIPDLVVIDKESVLGVLTDFDIVTKVVFEEKNPKETYIRDIFTKVDPIELKTSVEDALWILQKKSIPILPVTFFGRLRGIVSAHDCWTVISPEKWEVFNR